MELDVKLKMDRDDITEACLEWASKRLPAVEGMRAVAEVNSYLTRVTVTLAPVDDGPSDVD